MTESEVAEIVRTAEHVRISGGGTSAIPAREGATTLSMAAHSGITDFRPDDLVVSARAGTTLAALDAALRERGRRLPLRPFDDGRGTIGGAVAAAADGLSAREGFRWRDVVLGLRAVLGTGETVRVGAAVVKSVAGWDVARALVGSRGCLAAITEVTFRVEPIPEASASWTRDCDEDLRGAISAADGLPFAPRGLVVSTDGGASDVDVLLEGPAAAVEAAGLRLASAGFRRVEDAESRWADLTRRASAPPPAGSSRCVRRVSRVDPLAGLAAHGGIVADVLRQRATWIGTDLPPPRDAVAARLLERLREACDPASKFQPGRGIGAA